MEFQQFWLSLAACVVITGTLGFPKDSQTTIAPDECPEDSVLVNSTCECDHSLCKQPQCDQPLTMIRNRSSTPGECCSVSTCGLCSQESIIEGTCMCAVGAVRTHEGNCECTDAMKVLRDGVCICDADKCAHQQPCGDSAVQVQKNSDCCPTFECLECPEDSFPLRLHNDIKGGDIEDKCICYPCEKTECGRNETLAIIHRGSHFAGTCCDVYTCEERICKVNGQEVAEGESYVMDDEVSVCQNGELVLQSPAKLEKSSHCLHNSELVVNGSQWMDDECTQCTCVEEKVTCIAGFCNSQVDNGMPTCCAPLSTCAKTCTQGFKISEHGCALCKCNDGQDSFSIIHNYMWHHNISEADIIRKLTESPGFPWSVTMPFIAGAIFLLLIGIAVMAAHAYCKCPCRRQKKFHESEKVLLK